MAADGEPDRDNLVDAADSIEGTNSGGDEPQLAIATPPASKRYATRTSNKDRHPALDIGPNWKEAKRERDAAAAARALRKVAEDAKRLEKAQQMQARDEGVKRLAQLEDERSREESEEEEYIAASTARGYRKAASSVSGFQDHNVEPGVGANTHGLEGHGQRAGRQSLRQPSPSTSPNPSNPSTSEPPAESEDDVQSATKVSRIQSSLKW